jgi:hypothetical protein
MPPTCPGRQLLALALGLAASAALPAAAQSVDLTGRPIAAAAASAPGGPTAASPPDKSYAIPAAEIIGFDFLLNRFNRAFSGSSDYKVSIGSIRRNLHGPWVVDNDPFQVNQFAHPYQGSIYHTAARSSGLSYWEAAGYTFVGSVGWEIAGEQTPPSKNDQVASGIAGSFLGEPLFRMAHLVLNNTGGKIPYAWREWAAAGISPAVGFNRLLYGSRFDDSFSDHDPIYYGRMRIGANRLSSDAAGIGSDVKRQDAEIDFALDYGLPGAPGYSYTRPFDYFNFEAAASSANGVELLSTRGLLLGTDYALGASYRGIWGLYANYDYLAPQIFHLSTTALSIGTTGQWWASQDVALQGTGVAGIGYSAVSTAGGEQNDRDYHYGAAPRVGLSMRVIAGHTASFDVGAQRYFVGRIANRSAGRDDISRVDTALTWRIAGPHAIGIKYAWSHRSANTPATGDRTQTLGAVGIYYTLLGMDGFGTVDWRGATQQ